jgi:hypothetical protein
VNLVRIQGPRDVLVRHSEIDGLEIPEHRDREVSPGVFEVTGYATNAAIADMRGMGATVEIIEDEATREAKLEGLRAIIAENDDEPVG